MECGPHVNIIYGRNAAGKTAILEAIHLLARSNSFRTPRITDVIQYNKQRLSVTAELQDDDRRAVVTGLEKGRESTRIRFNGCKVTKRSEQAQNIPIFTVSPESQRLLSGTPKERRRWLDWSMFHVEQAYMENWQDYHHALRQRNTLLRKNAGDAEFGPWEEAMANAGAKIHAARNIYIQQLLAQAREITQGELGEINMSLKPDAETAETIRARLKQQRKEDIFLGHTRSGAHREDVCFSVNGRSASKIMSRGEGKLFELFLIIAQAVEYQARRSLRPIMLIDDLAAELDEAACAKMLGKLERQGLQLFMTTNHPGFFPESTADQKRFHVEHGRIVKVIE